MALVPSLVEPLASLYRPRRSLVISMLFVLPFLALVVQFTLIYAKIGEPYPAIMMPGFLGGRISADGIVVVRKVEIQVGFSDATAARTTLATLLAPMPDQMLGPSSEYMFRATPRSPVSALQPRVGLKAWLVDHVTPIRTLRYRRAASGNRPALDTTRWVQRRLESLFPDRRAKWIEFHWYRDTYRRRDFTLERIGHDFTECYRIDVGT
jgi:hypothetical protein